jgi:hypothetical protein
VVVWPIGSVNVKVVVPAPSAVTRNGASPFGAAVADAATCATLVFALEAVISKPAFVATLTVVVVSNDIVTGFGDETGADGSGVGVTKIWPVYTAR